RREAGSVRRCDPDEPAGHRRDGHRLRQYRGTDPFRAGTRRRPRLPPMTTPLDVWNLDTGRIGRRVLVYDVVDSTNNLAAALANAPANDGVAILAGRQTAGRGQHGRTWQTPANSAVLLSVLCFPPPPIRRAAVLTAWGAVAVCETVRELA